MANSRFFAALRAGPFVRLLILLHAGMLCTVGHETAWAQQGTDEYRAKAAFVFHFAQLVEWPGDAMGSGSLTVCTLGDDPFNGELEKTIAGKQVGTRTVQIRHFGTQQSTLGCNILFIGESVGKRMPSLITGLQNAPILTIGESDDFLKANGMIRLYLEGKKIRFEINRDAAESARLKVSSQLLLLAKTVIQRNGRR